MVIDNDILMHHGIEGQKWGHKNGPPYPLDPNKDYSKAEKKALRKEYRKEIRRRKKAYKRYEKEEKRKEKELEEERKLEEEKKKAIKSGKASLVDKYKDRMTDEEIIESINRIKVMQEFDKVKINELKTDNEKNREQINKIMNENEKLKQELIKKYGPGKGEAMLSKADRISKYIGSIADSSNKVLTAVTTGQRIKDKKSKFDANKIAELRKSRKERRDRLIDRVINSGDENLINKHLKKMSNEQVKSAIERLDLLKPDGGYDFDATMKFKEMDKKLEDMLEKYAWGYSKAAWDPANYY